MQSGGRRTGVAAPPHLYERTFIKPWAVVASSYTYIQPLVQKVLEKASKNLGGTLRECGMEDPDQKISHRPHTRRVPPVDEPTRPAFWPPTTSSCLSFARCTGRPTRGGIGTATRSSPSASSKLAADWAAPRTPRRRARSTRITGVSDGGRWVSEAAGTCCPGDASRPAGPSS